MSKKAKSFIFLAFLLLMVSVAGGCGSQQGAKNDTNTPSTETSKVIALGDLSKHNSKEDCWTAVEEEVYDMTDFVALGKHPPSIVDGCGKDATDLFLSKHSQKAKDKLGGYFIGKLQ